MHNPRRVVVAISDGEENDSRAHFPEIRARAREADVQVYSATLDRFGPDEPARAGFLTDLAELTGGRSFPIDERRNIESAAIAIAHEIHDQYVIGHQAPEGPAMARITASASR